MEITIGIPSYKRIDSLLSILNNLEKQKYKNFIVIISNDDIDTDLNTFINLNDYSYSLKIINQKENLGLIKNCLYLLGKANTKFFMWHADDDFISDNYIEENLKFLKLNDDFVCSAGQWVQVSGNNSLKEKYIYSIKSNNRLKNYISFIKQNSDHFIYGIFRTNVLKRCVYKQYFFPNKDTVENWCFPFLIQLFNFGKFNIAYDAQYYDNYDTPKFYKQTKVTFLNKIYYKLRRLNVYYLYIYYYFKL